MDHPRRCNASVFRPLASMILATALLLLAPARPTFGNGAGSISPLSTGPTAASSPTRAPAAATFDHSHAGLARMLKAAVNNGRVDYPQVRAQMSTLNGYLEQLAKVSSDTFRGFSRDEQLAFWINGYNARVLQVVAGAWPVASIQDIPGVFKTSSFTLQGQTLTLDRLENEIIRARFKEPRIHFALNCAAKSCPPLLAEPYLATRLEAQLEAAARAYLQDPRQNRFDAGANTVHLSRIFEWFGADFVERFGDRGARPGLRPEQAAVLNFASRYTDPRHRDWLTTGTPRISYLEYDWSINAR